MKDDDSGKAENKHRPETEIASFMALRLFWGHSIEMGIEG